MTGRSAESVIPQLHQLTGLRGLAAWFVVFYHMRTAASGLLSSQAMAVLAKGYLAVDLFFLLSGFVMWLNYGERLREGGWPAARQFWWKRVARIWPLHLLVLGAMMAFAIVLMTTGRAAQVYPIAELPLHIFLVQNWGLTDALSWNHPAWSISTEFAAYLLFPLVVWMLAWERLGTATLVMVACLLLGLLHFVFAFLGLDDLGLLIPKLGLVRCLTEFACGALLCILWQRCASGDGRAGLAAGLLCGALLVTGLAAGLPETLFVPAAMASGLFALALADGIITRFLGSWPMRWLGDISYATYLAHFFLFILFKILFVGEDGRLGWAGVGGYLFLVLVASAVLYHGFEKPAQRWVAARAPRGFDRQQASIVS
ncbi:MAG: acyltransferase [Erythrobacter sp.]